MASIAGHVARDLTLTEGAPSLDKQEVERHMLAVRDFVRNYCLEAELQIAFAWNGKHADEFIDSNMQFRKEVCDFFEEDKAACPLPLVAALFKAETLFAKEAWGVNRVVSSLAQELLNVAALNILTSTWPEPGVEWMLTWKRETSLCPNNGAGNCLTGAMPMQPWLMAAKSSGAYSPSVSRFFLRNKRSKR